LNLLHITLNRTRAESAVIQMRCPMSYS